MKSKIPIPVYDVDIFLDVSGKISHWSKQAEKIFGKKKKEVEGKKLAQVIIPENNSKDFTRETNKFISENPGNVRTIQFELLISNSKKSKSIIELSITSIHV